MCNSIILSSSTLQLYDENSTSTCNTINSYGKEEVDWSGGMRSAFPTGVIQGVPARG